LFIVFGFDIGEDCVGFWQLFFGLLFTTFRNRYPIRLRITAIVLAAGISLPLNP
jgi:hypothetical protein